MFNNIPPITKNIILINIIVYVVTNFTLYALNNPLLYNSLSGYYPESPLFKSWQIVTHMFMHAPFEQGYGVTHILFNMFTLYSFGPLLENVLSSKRYFILYFASGLGAFALFNLWNFYEVHQISSALENLGFNINGYLSGESVEFIGSASQISEQSALIEQLKSIMFTPMLGASGAVFGVIAAFAALYPHAKIAMFFIPIPIKVQYLLPIIIIISLYLGFSGNADGIAHFAHVGGAIVGYILARIWKKHLYRFN